MRYIDGSPDKVLHPFSLYLLLGNHYFSTHKFLLRTFVGYHRCNLLRFQPISNYHKVWCISGTISRLTYHKAVFLLPFRNLQKNEPSNRSKIEVSLLSKYSLRKFREISRELLFNNHLGINYLNALLMFILSPKSDLERSYNY